MSEQAGECARFQFANQAEVDFAYAQDWHGTLSREMIDARRHELFTAQFAPYVWKIKAIRKGGIYKTRRDTWLTKPYVPHYPPKALP